MKCIMCDKEGAKYRCRRCGSSYCTSECFKLHRSGGGGGGGDGRGGEPAYNKDKDKDTTTTSADAIGTDAITDDRVEHQHQHQKQQQPLRGCDAIMAASASDRAAAAAAETARQLQDPFSDASRALATGGGGEPDSPTVTTPTATATASSTADEQQLQQEGAVVGDDLETSRKRSRLEGEPEGSKAACEDNADPREGDAIITATTAMIAVATPKGEGERKDEDEEEGLTILSERHLRSLAHAPRIRDALKDTALQRLLRTIDGSRSRLDALDAAEFNNPLFAEFCKEVRAAIAAAEERTSSGW